MTGIVSMVIQGRSAKIVDFILSCRVMGRQIEEALLAIAIQFARESGAPDVSARYIPTARNKPCLDFFKNLAPRFRQQGEVFIHDGKQPYPVPEHIKIVE